MEKLPMCRICLLGDFRTYLVVNENLRKLYEKLTDNPFVTADSRPMLACCFCCTKLKQCYQFQRKCLESEELFAQMMNENYEPNPLLNQDRPKFCYVLSQSPIEHISIGGECQTESVAIKEELQVDCEGLDNIIEPEEEHQNDELELENQDNSFSHVEDVPAQHSESDSEDDVPLMEYKIEVEEHEVSQNKQRAGDTQRASTKKSKLGDAIAEDQKNNEQSDLKHIRTTENKCMLTVTKIKEPAIDSTRGHQHHFSLDTKCRKKIEDESVKSNKVTGSDFINKLRKLRGKEKSFKCEICRRSFNRNSSLATHICIRTDAKPYKCASDQGGDEYFQCDDCQRVFRGKTNLVNHIRTHTGEKPYKCYVCQQCFSDKSNLRKHVRTHTGKKPYMCDVCQRCFSDKSCLNRHIRSHTGEKPYKCNLCQSRFTLNSNLTRHILFIHSDEKPCKRKNGQDGEKCFKCDYCQRNFKGKSNLTQHIRTHTGEKPYQCDYCQRFFSDKYNLKTHIRTHTGEKPYKCNVCQKCFRDKSDLTKHIRTHTGEKPYNCHICPSSFIVSSHLKRHILITHTNEKPYKCDICQSSFSLNGHLKRHIRKHTGDKS